MGSRFKWFKCFRGTAYCKSGKALESYEYLIFGNQYGGLQVFKQA